MKKILYLTMLMAVFIFGYLNVCNAVGLPWSTSFDVNCTQDTNYPTDGMACGTNGTVTEYINVGACTTNGYQQVSSAANYPGGAGGRGTRKFICDGTNATTGHYVVSFNSPQTEFWIRFYTRWQPGFKWSSLGWEKFVWNGECGGYWVAGFQGFGGTTLQISNGGTGIPSNSWVCGQSTGVNLLQNLTACGTSGWNTIYPSGVSDGSWHYFQFHFKYNSSGANNGIYEQWVDGVKTTSYTNVNYFSGSCSGASYVELLTNQSSPNNGTAYWQDLDDIAISTTGYIGPVGGLPAQPSPPLNLR